MLLNVLDVGRELTLFITTLLLWITYLCFLATYRLYLSPLAKFPGPKLASLSNWYEFYYDVVLQGNFTFHIQDLHKQFGKPFFSPTL
jgi:hypothetical protein